MEHDSPSQRKAQLDKAEREYLEDVVAEMRDRVEDNVEFQLTQKGLDDEPEDRNALQEDAQQIAEAIELEVVDGESWSEAFDEYVTGVGYTIVNRLAALRCMEVRDFVDEEVTVFKENGLTPAAETLVHKEFLLEDEAILQAYHDVCDELAEEIEILFDRETAYSQLDPDDDTFEELCGMLDEVPDEVWRADDVLGWVYEYYNRPVVEALDAKNTLEPSDVGPANQFYTPHWVVRMLADNSLGKLYLEATGKESTVPEPETLSPEERKERLVTPEDSPSVAELCTYLIPDEEDQEAPSFDHPRELRVIDPACGSGHFLLYAFDILERIWWAETDLDRGEIPAKILKHNLYGVDIDLRSCQLSAFNLYLKARTRAEDEDNDAFEMPNLGIVAADARVAEVEEALDVLDEITGEGTEVRKALDEVIEEFQTTEALGSLLDVQGALEDEFMEDQTDVMEWGGDGPHTLNEFLRKLEDAVDERTSDSFGEQNLRSFLNLLVVLTQDYDVALMNPPYGSRGRMPDGVQAYVEEHYDYTTEYYINFFEACDRLVSTNGRVGMLVPWSFMFNSSFRNFREDFIGDRGSFDFFTEFGYDVLDNATVGTVGTVVRSRATSGETGTFIRLPDVDKSDKEKEYLNSIFVPSEDPPIQRLYRRDLTELSIIPGAPLSYWVPLEIRKLYDTPHILDGGRGSEDQSGIGVIRQGIASGNDLRFVRKFWATSDEYWAPYSTGGEDTWILPRIQETILWGEDGKELQRRSVGNGTPSKNRYFTGGITYNRIKRDGRRFGYLHSESVFGSNGPTIFADDVEWQLLSYGNSRLFTYLMLCKTSERMWQVGILGGVPWNKALENEKLKKLAKDSVGGIIAKRSYEFDSPHYTVPILLDLLDSGNSLPQYRHPHRDLRTKVDTIEPRDYVDRSESLKNIGVAAAQHLEYIEKQIHSYSDAIDNAVFDCFDINDDQRETILQEIALRTIEDPREREAYDPESITEPGDDFPEMVKDLLLHLTLRIVHEDDDGIVALSDVDRESDLLARIKDEFERIWGEYADARLAEVDDLLGSRPADEEAYPNLRAWLEDDLFEYHVSKFDRTPILWRLTTERLVSDPEGEGFACLIDYHQLDDGVFDRLQNRYLEPRKALLRERRSAANRRRSDDSLSASEQAEAADEYARCESGLEQIAVFEDRLAELAQSTPREWSDENRAAASAAAEQVAAFREQTADRLEALEELASMDDVDMEDLFSPSFYETVEENREEWIDALEELETAFEAYAEDGSEPVEAHLYDLFEYYDDLVGSAHYASNGILFTTYYYEQFEDAGQTTIADGGDTRRAELLAELASDLEEYRELAEEISETCDEVAADISSDWADRALSEITTAGYRPNHKHGVEINITPLAEADLVPKTVDDTVL
ncbi:BREX-5 system adenine-specific DNA-methyltransferase PglX [Halobellus rarus]|uniref:site-specific DNA-methyltransferase (adenine-specific) n=1 Tax=Halobellus rarus TaxID=1126237 RepID=A0ABD6CVM3_9EURY|nr:BREX-5 system adenine-specific DNA-methyltransferase PglX [Halobellus rarus]